jgi:DNA-binding response OmpR family regulator
LDLVVLDLDLAGRSGLEVLAEVRRSRPDAHVLILTASHDEASRVRGLVSGADDYVTKPFSVLELAARVESVDRRRRATRSTSGSPPVLTFGELAIDTGAREAEVGGHRLELTRREFDVLASLATSPRSVLSHEDLLRRAWGSSAAWQGTATVTEHIRRLRTKLREAGGPADVIVTVRGSGYRFDPP